MIKLIADPDERMERFFQMLANRKRIRIIKAIGFEEKCVTKINDILGMSQPNLSSHLRMLLDAGILKVRKDRNMRCYSLRYPEWTLSFIREVERFLEGGEPSVAAASRGREIA